MLEEVEKKQCWKCRGHKLLEMFSGRTLRAVDAWEIGQNGQVITLKK